MRESLRKSFHKGSWDFEDWRSGFRKTRHCKKTINRMWTHMARRVRNKFARQLVYEELYD